MRLVGLYPVRNEDWVCGLSLRVLLQFCDSVVALIHASTDRSQEIITNIAKETNRVIVVGDDKECWEEMRHRQALLELARADRATHLWIGDADEILTANIQPSIRSLVERTPRGHILQLPLYNLRSGITRYHADGIWGNRWASVAFADDPRLSWSGDRFHAREPGPSKFQPYKPIVQGAGGVMHLWASSLDRLRAKHRLYRCAERVRWPNKSIAEIERTYSWAEHGEAGHPSFGTPATWKYRDVTSDWWGYPELMQYLNVDAPNWQDAECARLIAEYGAEYFRGLRV